MNVRWYTPQIEAAQAYHHARIVALYAGQTPRDVIAIAGKTFGSSHGLAGRNDIDLLKQPEVWLADVLADMAANAEQAADRVTFRPLAIELDPLGVHFIDAILGAHVSICGPQYWSDELEIDLADFTLPDLSNSAVLRQGLRLARLAVQVSQGRLFVTTPVLSCAINVAINLFGQRLLEAMIERPEPARRVLRIVNAAIVAVTRAFFDAIPDEIQRNSVAENRYAPPGLGQIDGCATQLVSARHYREFLAGLDREVLGLSPRGGLMHLCGTHAHHISTWKAMPQLGAIQINDRAVNDLAAYFNGLREDQLLYVAPTPAFPVERILAVTRGRRIVLQCALERPILTSTLGIG